MSGMHVKKGDSVKVLCGKDKGKEGKILQVIPQKQGHRRGREHGHQARQAHAAGPGRAASSRPRPCMPATLCWSARSAASPPA